MQVIYGIIQVEFNILIVVVFWFEDFLILLNPPSYWNTSNFIKKMQLKLY